MMPFDAGLAVLLWLLLMVCGLICLTYLVELDQEIAEPRPLWDVPTEPLPVIEFVPQQRTPEGAVR